MIATLSQNSLPLTFPCCSAVFARYFTVFQSFLSQARTNSPTEPTEKNCSAVSPRTWPRLLNSLGCSCNAMEPYDSKHPIPAIKAFLIYQITLNPSCSRLQQKG